MYPKSWTPSEDGTSSLAPLRFVEASTTVYLDAGPGQDRFEGRTVSITVERRTFAQPPHVRMLIMRDDKTNLNKSTWLAYGATPEAADASIDAWPASGNERGKVRKALRKLVKQSEEEASFCNALQDAKGNYKTALKILEAENSSGPRHLVDLTTFPRPELPNFTGKVIPTMEAHWQTAHSPGQVTTLIDRITSYGLTVRLDNLAQRGWLPDPRPSDPVCSDELSLAQINGRIPQRVQCAFCGHSLSISSRSRQRDHMAEYHGIENPWRLFWGVDSGVVGE